MFSVQDAAVCTSCPIGQYQDNVAQSACTPCSAGLYGATTALKTAACSGLCDAGATDSVVDLRDSDMTGALPP